MAANASTIGRILLTGAAGRIGTAFREYNGARYQLRLADRDSHLFADPSGHEVVELEAADLGSCQAACKGVDVVIHLAADPSPTADFYDSLLENNIKATYNIFRAAKDQGCRRVIFASSIRVVEGYPQSTPILPDVPLRPVDMYGVSKCFGEAVAYYFAISEALSSIVIRIGAFEADWVRRNRDSAMLSRFVSRRDLSYLLAQCVEAADIPFAIVHGLSDNRFKRLDISSTTELIGYEPLDDGFQFLGANT